MARGFYGMFTPRLDDKGRITIPARYRSAFADGAMVVRGDTRCLYIFTTDEFDAFAEDAINTKVTDAEQIWHSRYLLAHSDYQTLDAQGRITLTGQMRDYAELDREVVLTGQGRRMEIWDAERWAVIEAEQEPSYIGQSGRGAISGGAATPTAGDGSPSRDDPATDDPATDDPATDDPATHDESSAASPTKRAEP